MASASGPPIKRLRQSVLSFTAKNSKPATDGTPQQPMPTPDVASAIQGELDASHGCAVDASGTTVGVVQAAHDMPSQVICSAILVNETCLC